MISQEAVETSQKRRRHAYPTVPPWPRDRRELNLPTQKIHNKAHVKLLEFRQWVQTLHWFKSTAKEAALKRWVDAGKVFIPQRVFLTYIATK